MGNDERWYFTKDELDNTPSRQSGYEAYKELSYRQQAANFIQDMGQKLKVSQLCINTAIVYMHRFYVFHSFTQFPWHSIAAAALFLAAKVEEQPRKLEHVIRFANICKNPRDTTFDVTSERYLQQFQDLVFNENVLLQTLGFDVAIDHPHTHVVRCCHLVRASKDLAHTSYFMASNRDLELVLQGNLSLDSCSAEMRISKLAYRFCTKSLHLTTMCLQYKPTVVACFCIHVACKWSNWEIPLSNEKKEWFSYVDPTVTSELLQQLTEEFLVIFEQSPSRLKEKIMAISDPPSMSGHPSSPSFNDPDNKKLSAIPGPFDPRDLHHRTHPNEVKQPGPNDDPHKQRTSGGQQQLRDREREYREKKEREKLAHHKPMLLVTPNKHPPQHPHHHPPVDPKLKPHSRQPSIHRHVPPPPPRTQEPRDILREAARELALKDHRDVKEPTTAREPNLNRDVQQKDLRRDFMLQKQDVKHSVSDLNCVNNVADSRVNYSDKRVDSAKERPVYPKLPPKHHDAPRRRDESKSYPKIENDAKKHAHDKINSYLNKPSTAQKVKSPPDLTKSVLNETNQTGAKNDMTSSNGGPYNLPMIDSDVKTELVKKASLFSPEKSPPRKSRATKASPHKRDSLPAASNVPPPVLPFDSPKSRRMRTSSGSSEPELRPVIKKIDLVQGFENLIRDNTIGIKSHQVPDIIMPIKDVKNDINDMHPSLAKELKPPDIIPPFNNSLVNGIETNSTMISNLLKEAPSVTHLPTVPVPTAEMKPQKEHHREHKKKNKEKHKHKDKERSREEKEKKKKHKDKEKEKHKRKAEKQTEETLAQPIKITIPKDKIHPPDSHPMAGLKIKIPKDKIKTENIGESSHIQSASLPPMGGGLKIKISKDYISNFNSDNKKRERDRSSPIGGPPNKISKSNHHRSSTEPKQNGKNSYAKVSNFNNTKVNSVRPPQFRSNFSGIDVNCMAPSIYPNQNQPPGYYYNYPPPNMQLPPPNMSVPFMFSDPQMYAQFYASGYHPMYPAPPPERYQSHVPATGIPPPLPNEPPPNSVPPPPPPE